MCAGVGVWVCVGGSVRVWWLLRQLRRQAQAAHGVGGIGKGLTYTDKGLNAMSALVSGTPLGPSACAASKAR